jgi:hypothetical protein
MILSVFRAGGVPHVTHVTLVTRVTYLTLRLRPCRAGSFAVCGAYDVLPVFAPSLFTPNGGIRVELGIAVPLQPGLPSAASQSVGHYIQLPLSCK